MSIPTKSAFAELFVTTCRKAMRPVTGPAPMPESVTVKRVHVVGYRRGQSGLTVRSSVEKSPTLASVAPTFVLEPFVLRRTSSRSAAGADVSVRV